MILLVNGMFRKRFSEGRLRRTIFVYLTFFSRSVFKKEINLCSKKIIKSDSIILIKASFFEK